MGAGARLDHRERAGSKRLPSSVQKKTSIFLSTADASVMSSQLDFEQLPVCIKQDLEICVKLL
jgi:hypothetical protein